MTATTWRDVKWRYDDGYVYARINGEAILICYVPPSDEADMLGRAIAHAWNVDLAAARSWRELFGVEDSVVKV